jgi:HPt (histidine-containing phosphotransfer) domain-containing protein
LTHPTATLRLEGEPIQAEAIDRLRRLGQDSDGESILALVVTKFRHEATRWRGEIHSRLVADDLTAIQRIAHTLRGSASVLGATRLVVACKELETCAAGGHAEGCAAQLPSFEEALSEVLLALSKVEPEKRQAIGVR